MGHLDPRAVARFARGDVSPDEAAQMRDHVASCAECRELVASRRTEAEAVTQAEPPERPAPGPPALASAPSPLERGQSIGRYIVLNALGQGGMGVVYAGYDPELDRKVALKVLRPGRGGSDGQARLLREAQAMARISHPNVIPVFDVGTLGDRVFVAMALIDGPTLKHWVKQMSRGWEEILDEFVQAGRGLSAAHAVGLVHRDFKPENVLVGADGRAYVMDFGLARLADAEDMSGPVGPPEPAAAGDEPPGRVLDAPLTQDGVVIGTPQYMAPEQHLGLPPDARSDQFSFCAALYWALYRRRAFDPDKLSQAAVDADAESPTVPAKIQRSSASRMSRITVTGRGVILEPPRDAKVPARIRRAMLRGLALRPEDRFPSIDALLAALTHDPWVARKRFAMVAAGVVAVGSLGLAYQQAQARRGQLCSGAERELARVWGPGAREKVERAFLGTGKDFARSASKEVLRLVDAYAAGWAAMHKDACEAAQVRKEQSEQVMSLRMACLNRRLQELGALAALFEKADAKLVEKAVDAAGALPPLRRCADVEALTSPVALPDDPAARASIQRVQKQLASVKALNDAGRFREGLEIAQAAAKDAGALGYAPLAGEALHLFGWLEDRTGDAASAQRTLEEAFRAAEVGRDDSTKVMVATKLAYSVGYTQGKPDMGEFWVRIARAALERIGGDDELEADLDTNAGTLLVLEGRYGDALAPYERALERVEKVYGGGHPKRALVLVSLGVAQTRKQDFAAARRTLEESLEIIERTKGALHPSAAFPHSSLAELARQTSDYEGAFFHLDKAQQIWESTLGPDHPAVANLVDSRAGVLLDLKRYAEALAQYRRALALKEKVLGPSHSDLAYSLNGLGQSLLELGRPQEAVEPFERALQLGGQDPQGAAEMRLGLARALWDSGRDRERAKSLARQAIAGFAGTGDARRVADAKAWLARISL